MSLGYFVDGLGRGLLSQRGKGGDSVDAAKFLYQKEQDKKQATLDQIKRERQEAARLYYHQKLKEQGLMLPDNLPAGHYKPVYDASEKRRLSLEDQAALSAFLGVPIKGKGLLPEDIIRARADNRSFGQFVGKPIPEGATMSDALLKTGMEALTKQAERTASKTKEDRERQDALTATREGMALLGVKGNTSAPLDTSIITKAADQKRQQQERVYAEAETLRKQSEDRSKTQVELEDKYRNEVNNYTAMYRKGKTALEKLKSLSTVALESDNPAATLGMIFSYMKALDPSSVVRESEYATAEKARGIMAIATNFQNRLKTGERISPEQINNFVSAAEALHGAMQRDYEYKRNRYRQLSDSRGLNFDHIWIGDQESKKYKKAKELSKVKDKDMRSVEEIMRRVEQGVGGL